jgi:hypothetical protein
MTVDQRIAFVVLTSDSSYDNDSEAWPRGIMLTNNPTEMEWLHQMAVLGFWNFGRMHNYEDFPAAK